MQIQLTGRNNLEITPALKTHVTEKMQRIEKRHANVTNVSVVLQVQNDESTAEGRLHFAGTELAAKADGDNMYTAIDEMVEKLLTQLTKHKEKAMDR